MKKIINFVLNNKQMEVAIEPGESMTDMLRNSCGMKSVKKGCEVGECGACAILYDGKTVNSCIMLADLADGHEIMTLEGITGKDGSLHPVQQAFIDEASIQCGFCIPGFVVTGYELYESGQKYTREEIREAISGHLCRCTGYENIVNALEKLIGKKS